MKKVHFILGFVVLLMINATYIVINVGLKKAFRFENFKYENLKENISDERRDLEENILKLTLNSGKKINLDICVTSEEGTVSTLGNIITNPTLVFNYFMESCYSCIEQEFQYMHQVFDEDEFRNIIVLTSEKNISKIHYIKERNRINIPFYRIESEYLGLPADKMNKPFMFILGNSDYPQNIFFPVVTSDSLSLKYYKLIESRGILN